MVKKLSELYDRTTYLNTFDLPHGKNLMPYSLKKVPLWFLDHAMHEIRIRIWDFLRSNETTLVIQKIRLYRLRKISKFQSENKTGKTKYLAASPHPRAGIGHQMSSVLAALELAHTNGIELAISGLPIDWATEFGFSPNEDFLEIEILKQLNLGSLSEVEGNKYTKQVNKALSKNYSIPILFRAPFNDSKNDLTFGGKLLQEQYLRANSADRPGKKKLVVHVRRPRVGDYGATGPMRNIPTDSYYRKILEVIDSKDFRENVSGIVLLGVELHELELLGKKLQKRTGQEVVSTLGCCDVGAFRLLATSEILICSRSGFSYTAALVNPGKIYFPTGFWHKVPDHWELF